MHNRRKADKESTENAGHSRTQLSFYPSKVSSTSIFNKFREIFSLDLRSLALMRIFLGLTIILDILDRAPDLSAHYTDDGVMPRTLDLDETLRYHQLSFCIHLMSGNIFWMIVLFILNTISGFCVLVGYRTRTSIIISWILISSLQLRNVSVLHSGDDLLRLLLFYSVFLPVGQYFSIDAFLSSCHKDPKEDYNDEEKAKNDPNQNYNRKILCSFGAFALMMQVLLMYMTAFFHKSGVEWRRDRTATWLALQMSSFRLPLGDIFVQFPEICKLLTVSVIHWQLIGPWLYFMPFFTGPLKTVVSVGFLNMHIGFAFCLRLQMFNWITITACLTLVPYWFWEFLRNNSTTERVIIHYDPKKMFSRRLVKFIEVFGLIPDLVVLSRKSGHAEGFEEDDARKLEEGKISPDTWLELEDDGDGSLLKNFSALQKVIRASPLFWPFVRILNRVWIKEKIMQIAASDDKGRKRSRSPVNNTNNSHQSLKRNVRKSLTRREILLRGSVWLREGFLLVIVICVIMWNLSDVHFIHGVPSIVRQIVNAIQLDQSWRMFAPRPPTADFWYMMIGQRYDGNEIEFFSDGGLYSWQPTQVRWEKPKDMLVSYRNHRWVKYFENGLNSGSDNFVGTFAVWVCNQHNGRQNSKKTMIKHLTIFIMWETYNASRPFDQPKALPKETFWEQTCPN
eukprot:TRINITY_DN17514_c0_g1_i1.p1 TRINITY_DN17514_c0_g1~~TRINITY_DN17514_c0_g1_i1.p1  ORF type:complete len:678 (-),score=89.46 TRINITY_DN17514_c0_g1_i1:98-2131(-)